MFNKKKKFLIVGILVLSVFVYIFTPKINSYFRWKRAAEATGALSYQIGLTGVQIYNCSVTLYPPYSCECTTNPMGTPLCFTKPVVSPMLDELCINNSYVSGTMAGGMGREAIFSNTAIAQAGVTVGGQLIAGGISPVLMSSGVLAGPAGCAGTGCMAIETGPLQKFKNWFAEKVVDFIIAGSKEK